MLQANEIVIFLCDEYAEHSGARFHFFRIYCYSWCAIGQHLLQTIDHNRSHYINFCCKLKTTDGISFVNEVGIGLSMLAQTLETC